MLIIQIYYSIIQNKKKVISFGFAIALQTLFSDQLLSCFCSFCCFPVHGIEMISYHYYYNNVNIGNLPRYYK